MKSLTLITAVLLSSLFTSTLWAEIISFDTVSRVDVNTRYLNGFNVIIISGIEKDTANPRTTILAASILEGGVFRPELQRCIPVFLMAMDKPGRYFLEIGVIDQTGATDASHRYFSSCGLEVKT